MSRYELVDNRPQKITTAIIDGYVTVIIVSIILMLVFGPSNILSFIFGESTTGTIYSFGFTLLVGVISNFIMGVLFCIGFTIIDFPMAIGLGILIGILDLVPYLHTFALIPTALLALLKAADTGQNFWIVFAMAVAVFAVVQVIIDLIVTPYVMGKAMRLNPAILLLSLSVWGALLGFIGLIIALPATTLLIAYYQRYITRENEEIITESEKSSE